jgi:hypothetical protein
VANYCSVSELKAVLRITDSVDDGLLTSAIEAASRFVDTYCDRDFTPAAGTATRDYVPTGRYERLRIEDAATVVSVKIDDGLDYGFATTLQPGDFQLEPLNNIRAGIAFPYNILVPFEDGYWPMEHGRATVRVEATYGWPAVPASVKQATILHASRLFTRYDSPLGVAGFGDMGIMRVSRFADPDVELLLRPFRRLFY